MKEFRVRKTDDYCKRWVVANGDKQYNTNKYIDKTGIVSITCVAYDTGAEAQAALDLYLEKQKPKVPTAWRTGEMSLKRFDALVDYIVEMRIKKVMCAKSKEYASGGNKLHNFDHAAQMRNITPMEALRGMKLKHEVSIEDMLNGLRDGKNYSRKLWEEKFTDNINYQILQWAILARDNNWFTEQEVKPGNSIPKTTYQNLFTPVSGSH